MKGYTKTIVYVVSGIFLLAIGFFIGHGMSDAKWEATFATNAAVEIAGLTPALDELNKKRIVESRALLNVQLDRNLGMLRRYQYRVNDPDEIKRHNYLLNYLFKIWSKDPPFSEKGYAEISDWKEIRESNDLFLKRSSEAHQKEQK